jgi:hypothetical protein
VGSSQALLGPEKMEPAGMVRGSGSGSGRSVHLAGLRSGVLRNIAHCKQDRPRHPDGFVVCVDIRSPKRSFSGRSSVSQLDRCLSHLLKSPQRLGPFSIEKPIDCRWP